MAKQKANLKENKIDIDLYDYNNTQFLNFAVYANAIRVMVDIRDGLTAVQRRVLHTMRLMGLDKGDNLRKSLQIDGETVGKFHPHGTAYSGIDGLTKQFDFWLTLIHPGGSFSDILGNKAAAPRYTQARINNWGRMILENSVKGVVPFNPNYDNTKGWEEPAYLSTTIPLALINGARPGRMAYGYAPSNAPHNPVAATKAVNHYMLNKDKDEQLLFEELVSILKAPDFPTGGYIAGDPRPYYRTGKGTMQVRCKCEETNNGIDRVLRITEVPFTIAGSLKNVEGDIKDLIDSGQLPGATKAVLYADDKPWRTQLDISLTKKADIEHIKTVLFAKTKLSGNYHGRFIATYDYHPYVLSLLDYMKFYFKSQNEQLIRRSQMELKNAEDRLNIVNALMTLNDPVRLDAIIKIARDAKSSDEVIQTLMKTFNYNEDQAAHIAKRRIQSLNALDLDKIKNEKKDLDLRIYWADRLINDETSRINYIVKKNNKLIELFTEQGLDKRRTEIVDDLSNKPIKDIEVELTMVVNEYGYVKLTDRVKNKTLKDDEVVYNTTNNDILVGFSSTGIMYQKRLSELRVYPKSDKSNGDLADTLFDKFEGRLVGLTLRSELEADDTEVIFIAQSGKTRRTLVKDSNLLTKTVRTKTKAYPVKDSELAFAIVRPKTTEPSTISAIKTVDDTEWVKRTSLADIPIKASGTGTQVFYEKRRPQPIETIVIECGEESTVYPMLADKQALTLVRNAELVKTTQAFKPASDEPIVETPEATTDDTTDED